MSAQRAALRLIKRSRQALATLKPSANLDGTTCIRPPSMRKFQNMSGVPNTGGLRTDTRRSLRLRPLGIGWRLQSQVQRRHHHNEWRERFRAILSDFRFLPGGRILAGAGTSRRDTLFNCFVMVTRTAGIIASAFCSGCRCQRRRSVAHDGNGAVLCGQCNFQDGAATAKRKRTGDWTRLATSLGVWA